MQRYSDTASNLTHANWYALLKEHGLTLEEMRELLDALAVLDDDTSTAAERAEAADAVAQFHRRAADACATLSKQLGYARELTEQLDRYQTR